MEKLVKVKYVIARHKVMWIDVKESEVASVKEANRMFWRQDDKEKRDRKLREKLGIKLCSMEELSENGFEIASEYIDPIDKLIEKEERKNAQDKVKYAMQCLNEEQREIVELRFFEGKTIREISKHFGVTHQSIMGRLKIIYKKMKKILENDLPRPSKNSVI